MEEKPIIISILREDISEHMRNVYSTIEGKELYPVALNPLEEDTEWYCFGSRARYNMIR